MRPHRSHILALFGQSLLACAVDPHAWQVRSIGQRDARCPAREEGKQEAVGEHAHGFSDDRRRRCARVSPRSHGHLSIISSSHHHIISSSRHRDIGDMTVHIPGWKQLSQTPPPPP